MLNKNMMAPQDRNVNNRQWSRVAADPALIHIRLLQRQKISTSKEKIFVAQANGIKQKN
jgi:hypothetical protein